MADGPQPRVAFQDWLWFARRIAIWAVFIGLLYWLRDFFLLIFLTFVFAYSAGRAVAWLEPRLPRIPRKALVAGVFLGCLGAVVGLVFLMVPRVDDEVVRFKDQFPKYRDAVLKQYETLREEYPIVARAADRALGAAASLRDDLLGSSGGAAGATATAPATTSLAAGPGQGPAVSGFSVAVDWISGFVAAVISAVTTVFLALLFAFLILIDRSNITEEVRGFESSRVSWLYAEVRESLMEVAASVGSILEAFAIISLVETTVIVLVLWILGLPSLLLVGVITFFLGLIPIVGQVVPVLPIAWIAFASGGSPLLVKSLIAYGAVRLIAAYTFEPKVFGRRFHFSMLFTLVSLMIGFKAAGIWGIILGLPIAYSIVRPRTNPHFTITTHP